MFTGSHREHPTGLSGEEGERWEGWREGEEGEEVGGGPDGHSVTQHPRDKT